VRLYSRFVSDVRTFYLSYFQIGSIDVQSDVDLDSPHYNSTFGSGGGFPGAGYGGGRILIKATGTVIIHPSGLLAADGSMSDDPLLGAGSGGSVTISAAQCALSGAISAKGGNSHQEQPDGGAAGGGGRVAIVVSLVPHHPHVLHLVFLLSFHRLICPLCVLCMCRCLR
jgi:hypothetical protein